MVKVEPGDRAYRDRRSLHLKQKRGVGVVLTKPRLMLSLVFPSRLVCFAIKYLLVVAWGRKKPREQGDNSMTSPFELVRLPRTLFSGVEPCPLPPSICSPPTGPALGLGWSKLGCGKRLLSPAAGEQARLIRWATPVFSTCSEIRCMDKRMSRAWRSHRQLLRSNRCVETSRCLAELGVSCLGRGSKAIGCPRMYGLGQLLVPCPFPRIASKKAVPGEHLGWSPSILASYRRYPLTTKLAKGSKHAFMTLVTLTT